MEPTHIIQFKAKLKTQKVENHQRTLTKVNGKQIPSTVLANKHTKVLVYTTDIGKTERGTGKVL